MGKRIYGLIGFPLTHSFSKKYFSNKFVSENLEDCEYSNFEIPDIKEVKLLLLQEDIPGLNVTIPYKKLIIPYLDAIDDIASKIGAVNCIKRIGDSWKGFNTDIVGFENSLKPLLNKDHTNALVLGTGGASQAVCYVLKKLGIGITRVSSQGKEETTSYYDLDEGIMGSHQLIINTTPLGTYPEENEFPPIPYEHLSSSHVCFDVIYNPEETLFLQKSKAMGAQIKNGYDMLVGQAEESWRLWNTIEN